MSKGKYTQGFFILLKKSAEIKEIEYLLKSYKLKILDPYIITDNDLLEYKTISKEQSDSLKKWLYIGPSILLEYDSNVNGNIRIDIVNDKWPDHMGDPKIDPGLFAAWSMGYFGSYTFPKSLEHALSFARDCPNASELIIKHQAIIRIQMTYVYGAKGNDPMWPDNYDPISELTFMTDITIKLMQHPNALCYFNPNGEILLDQRNLAETFASFIDNKIPPFPVWCNIRLFNIKELGWFLIDSVGNQQFDIPDLEFVIPDELFSNTLCRNIQNATLYLLQSKRDMNEGDTIDGIDNFIRIIHPKKEGFYYPPRPVYRFIPKEVKSIPDIFLNNNQALEKNKIS